MAEAMGLAIGAVQKIWRAHGLAPHRLRVFKLSRDPQFAVKVRDVVGLYVDPPAHSLVLSVDEKSQIQALDRTQPGLPMKPGRAGTITTTISAIACPERKPGARQPCSPPSTCSTARSSASACSGTATRSFCVFSNHLEHDIPAGKLVHVILDNYGSHKHPKVRAWLAPHPRWTFHFTPTSASWLNAVEGFFAKLTRRRLSRGIFHSLSRPAGHHQPLLGRTQPQPKTIHLDRRPRSHHRRGKPRVPSVKFDPLRIAKRGAAVMATPSCYMKGHES